MSVVMDSEQTQRQKQVSLISDDDLKKQVPEFLLTALCLCAVPLPLLPPAQKSLTGKIHVFWPSLLRSNYLILKMSRFLLLW